MDLKYHKKGSRIAVNNVWARYTRGQDESLGKHDVTPAARRFLHKVVRNNLKIFNKPRFLSKCPGNSVRMEFLNEIFPDAIFLHIIRDGRAVAYSIMRSRQKHSGRYWSTRPPGWRDLLQRPMLEACALQWKMIVEHVLNSVQSVPPDQYLETKYEDFILHPAETLKFIGNRCGLEWSEDLLESSAIGLENRNFKWQENLNPAEKDTLTPHVGELLARLGY
jgi:hypothetical protein